MNLSERVCPDCLVVVSFKWLSRNVQQAFILLIVLLFAAKARNTKNPEVKLKGQQTVNKARKKKKKKKKKKTVWGFLFRLFPYFYLILRIA